MHSEKELRLLITMNNSEKYYSDFGEYSINEYIQEYILSNPLEMERFDHLINLVPEDTETLVDVGCGPGVFLYLLSKRRGIKCMGIEISDNKISYAKESLSVHVEKGDAGMLHFNDRSFDVVTANEVIEHLPFGTYKDALKEIARVSRKYIIITVPYDEKRDFMTCPYCETIFNSNYHLRSFSEREMNGLFPGFDIEKIDAIGIFETWPAPMRWINHIRKRKQQPADFFLCPACGFSHAAKKSKNTVAKDTSHKNVFIKNFARELVKLLPKIKKARWLAVLYKRIEK